MGAVDGGGVSGCGTGVIGALPFLSDPGISILVEGNCRKLMGRGT